MSARILFTVGGMAINARHRRDVPPAYRTGFDEPSLAECDLGAPTNKFCPSCRPEAYPAKAKHRAEVAS